MLRPLLITLALALPAHAETMTPVKTAELSARLYATGVTMADPLLILSAAKLRKTLAPTPTARAATDGTSTTEAPLSWEDMLAEAEALSEGDDVLLGLIDDVRSETTKGVATGPVYNIGSIGNGKSDTYPVVDFIGGEYAEVYVEAKSATDLNLTITDAQGRLVCSDTDVSHIAYCGWRPADTAGFVLKVENNGPTAASYALMTN
ncbi:MAG: hypothetical protein ACRC14_09030 [Paracoccaceae bacterium]